MTVTTKKIVVFYHGDCPDGFSASWAAWKKFGTKAEYIGLHHQTPYPKGLKNKEIYFLDFVYPENVMRKYIKNNKRVTAIDHHVSMEKSIKLTQDHVYDISHSGAVLAWKYFHPSKPVPDLLKYIEDTDIWKFRMPHSRAMFSYLSLQNKNFKIWSSLAKDLQNKKKTKEYIEKGEIIIKYVDKLVKRLIEENSESVVFEGYKTSLVNAPHFFSSRIGSILYKRIPPMAIIWSEAHEMITVSLRSDGSVDVAKLAKRHGGGGHKGASGFAFKAGRKAPWKKINKNGK